MVAQRHSWFNAAAGAALALVLYAASMPIGASESGVQLGAVDLRSLFGERLRAEIPLELAQGTGLREVGVQLASYERFTAMGLDRDQITVPVQISLEDATPDHGPRVVIVTRSPLREPVLALVLELAVREEISFHIVDVVLSGPPRVANVAVPTVDEASATAPQRAPGQRRAAVPNAPVRSPAPGRQVPRGSAQDRPTQRAANEYGPTERFDTLYGIASKVRPDRSVSIREMAMALFRANPHAFSKNNINHLRLGVVLKVPLLEGGSSGVERERSGREFRSHMQAWRGESAAPAPGSIESVKPKTSSRATVIAAVSPSASGEANARADLFRQRVAAQREARMQLDESNTELRTRMERLDQRIAAIRALIDRHGNRIDALQSQAYRIDKMARGAAPAVLTDARGASETPPLTSPRALPESAQASDAGTAPVEPPVARAEPVVVRAKVPSSPIVRDESVKVASNPASPRQTEARPQTQAPPISSDSAPKRAVPAAAPVDISPISFFTSLLRSLTEGWRGKVGLALIALLVAALAGWVVARRSKSALKARRYEEREAGLRSKVSAKAAQAIVVESPAPAPRRDASPARAGESSHDVTGNGNMVDPELAVAPSDESMQALFREVDVYVAYGRFDDAATRLRRAMEESPDQYELRAKLGEVWFEAGDTEAFVELARSLYLRLQEQGDETLWRRIALLGERLVPEERLFQQTLAADAVAEEPTYDRLDELAERRSRRG